VVDQLEGGEAMTSRPTFDVYALSLNTWTESPFLSALKDYLAALPGTHLGGGIEERSQPASNPSAGEFAFAAERLAIAAADLPEDPAAIDSLEWSLSRKLVISLLQQHVLFNSRPGFRELMTGAMTLEQLTAVNRVPQECARVLRLWLVYRPDLLDDLPDEVAEFVLSFRIPLWAYLRSMWNLFWSAIRYPFSETTIDLSTGRVLYRT
jgi:hypothetical protein